jgi:hypothetical protein
VAQPEILGNVDVEGLASDLAFLEGGRRRYRSRRNLLIRREAMAIHGATQVEPPSVVSKRPLGVLGPSGDGVNAQHRNGDTQSSAA